LLNRENTLIGIEFSSKKSKLIQGLK